MKLGYQRDEKQFVMEKGKDESPGGILAVKKMKSQNC